VKKTDGNVVDYREVRKDLNAFKKLYDIRSIRYDEYNATHLAMELQDEDGIEVKPMSQGMMSMAEPTKEFERLILSGRMAHPDNLVMNWMVGVATTKYDSNGNYKIVKPDPKGYEKVDGPQSGVMALAGALNREVFRSAYDDPSYTAEGY
jgi:phage terminase large subunit-like protein